MQSMVQFKIDCSARKPALSFNISDTEKNIQENQEKKAPIRIYKQPQVQRTRSEI